LIRAFARLGIRAGLSRVFALLLPVIFLTSISNSLAQAPTQQYIYANVPATPPTTSTLAAYAKNGQTGSLSGVPGTPFPDHLEGGRLAVDALGRFLFVLNPVTNGISMFQINSSTGALAEVPNSPFNAGPTINPNQAPAQPISLATEKSGKYLYVGYTSGNISNFSAITPFVIDSANLRLTLTDQLSFDVNFNPVQMLSDPRGLFLYVVNGPNPFTAAPNGAATVYSITETDGSLALNGSAGSGSQGRSMASDPQGRFFFDGNGQFEGALSWGTISPLDGTNNPNGQFLNLGENNYPEAMVVDSSGKFLYVQQSLGLVIYSINQTTGQPTPLTSPLASPKFQLGNVVADPAGAFLYSGSGEGIHAYQVNAQDGSLTEVANSPFPAGGTAFNLAISGTSVQAISGPSASFTLPALNFGSVTESQQVTLVTHLVNNGDQSLTINLNSVSISGPNSADFSESTTCSAALSPNANCSFSVTFKPSTATTESATLQINDNAPGSPQNIPLSGIGLAPSPSVAFVPGSLTFNPIAQGQMEGPQTFQITNIGSATLHISNVAIGGSNPQDFSQTNNCTSAPVAVNASCNINVSFTPLATGQRSASITLADDAPSQTQTIFVQGNGALPFQLNPSLQSATTASITAGQTAQYNLQLNPGTGFTGNVSISCTGAPLAATCSLSSTSISVSSSNPVAFTARIATSSGTSAAAPMQIVSRTNRPNTSLSTAVLLVLLFFSILNRQKFNRVRPTAIYVSLLFASLAVWLSGCGGASNVITPPPQQIATPKGTYTITVSATANNLPSQTVSLTLTVN
jgi:6-phosphogluconolactonase (cycloisomerase 2 family)